MKKIFTLYFIPFTFYLLFSGCQSALNVFNKTDTQYEKGLQHTKVKPILFKDDTIAIINATYLNSINTDKWNDEKQNFLIGIYISKDEKKDDKKFINNPQYKITLNGKNYIKAELFTKEHSKLYKDIPLKNPWAKYYLVSFNDIKNKTVKLEYTHIKFGKAVLSFEKE